jgi:hypothetical protein
MEDLIIRLCANDKILVFIGQVMGFVSKLHELIGTDFESFTQIIEINPVRMGKLFDIFVENSLIG